MNALDQIVTRLLTTESLAHRSRWLIVAAIAVWLAISVLALIAQDPGHFSRAGAVGTGFVLAAFAVNAAARQAYQTHLLQGLVLITRANLRDREGRPLMRPSVGPEDTETATRDYDHNLEAIGRLFARLERRSTPARMTEVGAAAISTLQWGYGDLFMNKTIGCGAWTC